MARARITGKARRTAAKTAAAPTTGAVMLLFFISNSLLRDFAGGSNSRASPHFQKLLTSNKGQPSSGPHTFSKKRAKHRKNAEKK
jgi:hypothetical protein